MIWINSISELQFYNQDPKLPCYSESLAIPSDLILQGSYTPSNVTNFGAYLYTPDGLTIIETISSYFDVWYGINPVTGQHFFNARLRQFTPGMCEHKCWIIRVIISTSDYGTVFDKYTERYLQLDCCDTARDIDIGDALVSGNIASSNSPLVGDCGEQLIRLVTEFDCYDNFSGDYYGIPPVVIAGNANFSLVKTTVFNGRIVRRPKNIERTISYNCRLQRSESTAPYLLEGFEMFPTWKMTEIENQLHAPNIWVEDYPNLKQYQFSGGQVFDKVQNALNCMEVWKLSATLEDCTIRQTFGCPDPCAGTQGAAGFSQFFVIPDNYVSGNPLYNDAREVVAYNTDDLLDYLRNQEGVSDAGYVATSPVDCDFDSIIGMAAEIGGFLPKLIYVNNLSPTGRVYAVTVNDVNDICDFVKVAGCPTPTVSYTQVTATSCATPEIDYTQVIQISPETVTMTSYGDWDIDSQSGSLENLQVLFSLTVSNDAIPVPEDVYLNNEIIGVVPAEARPSSTVQLDSSNNGTLNDEQIILIDEYGVIRYTGEPTTYNESDIEIALSNLIYNI